MNKKTMRKILQDREFLSKIAGEVIDLVEDKIRRRWRFIEDYAHTLVEDGERHNSILYGEAYYDLEEEIITAIQEFFEGEIGETHALQ